MDMTGVIPSPPTPDLKMLVVPFSRTRDSLVIFILISAEVAARMPFSTSSADETAETFDWRRWADGRWMAGVWRSGELKTAFPPAPTGNTNRALGTPTRRVRT